MNKLAKRALKSSSVNEGKKFFIRFFQLLEIAFNVDADLFAISIYRLKGPPDYIDDYFVISICRLKQSTGLF